MTDTIAEHADETLHKGESLIEMVDVGKTYGAIRALKGINLTVNAGEVSCVLGDNGAGKSTLIKIMAGVVTPDEGRMTIKGEDVAFASPAAAQAAEPPPVTAPPPGVFVTDRFSSTGYPFLAGPKVGLGIQAQYFGQPLDRLTGMVNDIGFTWTKQQIIKLIKQAKRDGEAVSVGLVGNAAEVFPELLERQKAGTVEIDIVTDQTSAHDPLSYLPIEIDEKDWHAEAEADPDTFTKKAQESMARQVEAMVGFQDIGAEVFDYGNSIRDEARKAGYSRAFEFPGFVPAYIRPLFCRGVGPFRWVALSGDPADIHSTDAAMKRLFPENAHLHRWLDMAHERIAFQGLPARICWIGLGDRHRAGLMFNDMVASGELRAPIVIGRDHLDSGSVASPNRETEAMKDGSDAVSDWPLLNALLNTASGATWVSLHHGGGVGIGFSQHAGMVIVADGTEAAAKRLERVLWNDPATGVMRHADAGYEEAIDCAREQGLDLPSLGAGG